MASATDATRFASALPPESVKLLLEQPANVVKFAQRLDRMQIKPAQAAELQKIGLDQWHKLVASLKDAAPVKRAVEMVQKNGDVMGAVRAMPELENEVKKALETAGTVITFVGGMVAVLGGLIVAVLAVVALFGTATLPALAAVVGPVLGLILAFVALVAGVGSLLLFIAYFLPSTYAGAIGTEIYGGSGGTPFVDDIKDVKEISSIVLRCGGMIDGFEVKYRTFDGQVKSHGWHGGRGGTEKVIQFQPGEYITSVAGRSGGLIDQLTIKTNLGVHGPFGGSGGKPFELWPMAGEDRILGFHGRCGGMLDALGVSSRIHGGGLVGGGGGSAFVADLSRVQRILRVMVNHGAYIDAIQFECVDETGQVVLGPRIGGNGGKQTIVTLAPDEYITEVGTRSGAYVDRLVIKTNKNQEGYSFGGGGGSPNASWVIGPNERLTSFWGRSGGFIDAIGITKAPK